jgi:adenosine deaminase
MLHRMNLRDLPKVELHRHLELALRPSTIRELAPMNGIHLASTSDFEDRFLILQPMADLGSVLNKFLDTQSLLSSYEILERIAYEACEDAYLKENIRILELRYAPTFVQMGHSHLTFDGIQEAIVRGVTRAERDYPIAVGLICIIQRILPVAVAESVVDFAIRHRDTFVALDLADNEDGFDSKPFAPLFLRAKKAGMKVTIHSGEAALPNAPRYVREAVEHLGADRIGHGVQIHRDLDTMIFMRDRKIPLELCVTSNYLTQAVPTIDAHPFRQLLDFGVTVTINTDDPGIFNTDLIQEMSILRDRMGLSWDQLSMCMDVAANKSFIPTKKRQKVWTKTLTE